MKPLSAVAILLAVYTLAAVTLAPAAMREARADCTGARVVAEDREGWVCVRYHVTGSVAVYEARAMGGAKWKP